MSELQSLRRRLAKQGRVIDTQRELIAKLQEGRELDREMRARLKESAALANESTVTMRGVYRTLAHAAAGMLAANAGAETPAYRDLLGRTAFAFGVLAELDRGQIEFAERKASRGKPTDR